MYLRDVPWRHALALAADALNARVVRDDKGVYILRARKRNLDIWEAGGSFAFRSVQPTELFQFMRVVARLMASKGQGRSVSFELPDELKRARIMFSGRSNDAEDLLYVVAEVCNAEIVQDGGQLRLELRDR